MPSVRLATGGMRTPAARTRLAGRVHRLDTAVQPQVRTIDRCPSMSGTMRRGAVKSQHLQSGVAAFCSPNPAASRPITTYAERRHLDRQAERHDARHGHRAALQ